MGGTKYYFWTFWQIQIVTSLYNFLKFSKKLLNLFADNMINFSNLSFKFLISENKFNLKLLSILSVSVKLVGIPKLGIDLNL